MASAGLMTKCHERALERCFNDLVKTMSEEVLDPLLSAKVINMGNYETIQSKSPRSEKIRELLTIIRRKPDWVFQKLVDILAENDQQHLANILIAAAGESVPPCSPEASASSGGAPINQQIYHPVEEQMRNLQLDDVSGRTMASVVKETDHKMNLDAIIQKTREFSKVLPETERKVLVAVVDTGIDDEMPVVTRIGDNSKVQSCHGTEIAYLLKRYFPDIELVDVRISTNKEGTFSEGQMADGLRKLREWEKKSGRHVDIVNISMGLAKVTTDAVREQIHQMYAKQVIICAGSNEGHRGDTTIIIPASIKGTIAVGSRDEYGNRSCFSPVGDQLDFLCPGNFIFSGKEKEGTSYSAPIATAIAAHVITAARYFCVQDQVQLPKVDVMKIIGRTSGMRSILQQMCTESSTKTNKEGWGRLIPWKLYNQADLKLKAAILDAYQNRS